MFIYYKYQMGDESLREIKGRGNMFIFLLGNHTYWKFKVPAGH